VVGDDPPETAQLLDGLRRWAGTHPGATVSTPGPGAPLTVASCAATG
jgi:hypothetical protein